MAIPDYQTCMLPLLQFAKDGKEHSIKRFFNISQRSLDVLALNPELIATIKNGQIKKRGIDKTGFQTQWNLKSRRLSLV